MFLILKFLGAVETRTWRRKPDGLRKVRSV